MSHDQCKITREKLVITWTKILNLLPAINCLLLCVKIQVKAQVKTNQPVAIQPIMSHWMYGE